MGVCLYIFFCISFSSSIHPTYVKKWVTHTMWSGDCLAIVGMEFSHRWGFFYVGFLGYNKKWKILYSSNSMLPPRGVIVLLFGTIIDIWMLLQPFQPYLYIIFFQIKEVGLPFLHSFLMKLFDFPLHLKTF